MYMYQSIDKWNDMRWSNLKSTGSSINDKWNTSVIQTAEYIDKHSPIGVQEHWNNAWYD